MRAALGSIAVHAGLLAAAAWIVVDRPARRTPPIAAVSVEVVDRAPEPDPPAVDSRAAPSSHPSGGGGSPRLAHRAATRRARASGPEMAAETTTRIDDGGADGAAGEGAGRGGGHGTGIGFGAGGGLGAQPPPPPPPPPPAIVTKSLARPARLIYPTRERDVAAENLFVARITIDTDGYVVGAHFQGKSSDVIWRFRYDPARDDLGRPVPSTIDQPFCVQ